MNSEDSPEWYIKDAAGVRGPCTLDELRVLTQKKQVSRNTLIRKGDLGNWIKAGQVPAVFAIVTEQVTGSKIATASRSATPTQVDLPPELPDFKKQRSNSISVLSYVIGFVAVLCATTFVLWSSNDSRQPEDASEGTNAASPLAGVSLPTEQLVESISASVAAILTESGSGSGFVVAPGILATNYHVVADARAGEADIQAFFPDAPEKKRGPLICTLIAEAPDSDLALLQFDGTHAPLQVAKDYKFRRGQDIVIIGSPGFIAGQTIIPNAVSRGVLSSEITFLAQPSYQLGISVNPGNSGGPVFLMDSSVIGVVKSKSTVEDDLSFCVPASVLLELLSSREFDDSPIEKCHEQHNARRIIRELYEKTVLLTALVVSLSDDLGSKFGENTAGYSGGELMTFLEERLLEEKPVFLKDYSIELSQFSRNSYLNANQRSAITELNRIYRRIQQVLENPPSSLRQLGSQVTQLNERFVEQLTVVNDSIELGLPHVFYK